jgi:hypothetical protein
LSHKFLRCEFVGYDLLSKEYWCFCPEKNKIIISKDVIFDEDYLEFSLATIVKVVPATTEPRMSFPVDLPVLEDPTPTESDVPNGLLPPPTQPEVLQDPSLLEQDHSHDLEASTAPVLNSAQFSSQPKSSDLITEGMTLECSNSNSIQSSGVQLEVVHVHEGPHTRVGRPIHPPQRLHDFVLQVAKVVAEPTSYSEASQTTEWVDAMEQEMKSIQNNNTWTLVDLPVGSKPITTKWVQNQDPYG